MLRYIELSLKNVWRNRRRTILTLSSMAMSLCLLGILLSVYKALFYNEATPGQALRVIVRHKVSLGNPIPVAYENQIRQVAGVKEISPWNWFGGTYKDAREFKNMFARFGVDPAPFLRMRTQMEMPEDQRRAFVTDRTACIISKDLADSLHFQIGDRVTLQGDIYPVNLDLTVRGIFEDPDAENTMFFNMEYLRQNPSLINRSFDSIIAILANSPGDVPRISRTVDEMYATSQYPTKTESEQQFALSFVAFLGNMKLYLLIICCAVIFTILLVSGNTMAMAVRERIREVGVLKTLGFTNDAILGMILSESVAVAMIGGFIGIMIALLIVHLLGSLHQPWVAQIRRMELGYVNALICAGVAGFVGIVAAFVPAVNAARTNILDSLRYAG